MRRLFGGVMILTTLFLAAGLAIAREWEAPPAGSSPPQIVFSSRFPDGTANAYVRIISADGSGLRFMNVGLSYLCSPNGNYFAYLSGTNWQVLKADGSEALSVRLDVDPYHLIGLALTNDGRLVALNQNRNRQEITIAQAGSAAQRYPIRLPFSASSFSPSADDRRMAVVADSPWDGVYVANLDGTRPAKVLAGVSLYADWSPDASAIFSLAADHVLEVADVNTFHSVRVTPALEYGAAWSPDGDSIAFTRNGDIFTVELNDFHEHQLTFDGSNSNMWPCFLSARPLSLVGP